MADLFGGSTLPGWMSPGQYALAAQRAAPQSHAGSTILSLLGMAANMQANSIPSAEDFAGKAGAAAASKTGADIPAPANKPAWMENKIDLSAGWGTPGVTSPGTYPTINDVPQNTTVTPTIQDAPLSGYIEPPAWMNSETSSKRASNWQDFTGKLFSATDMNELNSVVAENSGVLTRKPVREAINLAKSNLKEAENFKHKQTMEELARQRNDNNSVKAKLALNAEKDLLTRVGKLPVDSQVEIQTMTDPAMKLKALQTAEAAQKLALENERAKVEAEALARGDVQRTTITERGVTKTFTPPKAETSIADIPEPVSRTIGGKEYTVLRTGPSTFQWKAQTGEVKPLSDADALSIGKGFEKDTASRKFWMNQAGSMAVGRMTPEQRTAALGQLQNGVDTLLKVPEKKRTPAQTIELGDLQEQLSAFKSQETPTVTPIEPTATNPTTGEKLILRNGQWQPIQK